MTRKANKSSRKNTKSPPSTQRNFQAKYFKLFVSLPVNFTVTLKSVVSLWYSELSTPF